MSVTSGERINYDTFYYIINFFLRRSLYEFIKVSVCQVHPIIYS